MRLSVSLHAPADRHFCWGFLIALQRSCTFSLPSACGSGSLIKRYHPPFTETFGFKKNSASFPNGITIFCLPSPTGSLIAPEILQFVITAAARWGLGGTPPASVPAFVNLPEVPDLSGFSYMYVFHEVMSNEENAEPELTAAWRPSDSGTMLTEEGEL